MRISVGSSGFEVAARRNVDRAFDRVAASSERLATMQRIRHPGDDPAQFMAAVELRGELTAIEKGLAARVEVGTSEKEATEATEAIEAALAGMAASLSGAYSQIADTDVASETSEFARSMILAETSIMALKFTNFARESAASLLDDLLQRLR